MANWQKEMTDRVGQRVKELRGDRTAVWLSEQTEKLGMKISRSAISELESGKRRSISVAELLILAAALQVPPLLLLYPNYPHGTVEAIPGLEVRSVKAANWVSGDRLLILAPDPSIEPFPNRLVELVNEYNGLAGAWIEAIRDGSGSGPGTFGGEILERRGALLRQIEEAGGVVDLGEG